MTIADRVKQLREAKGWSQANLADAVTKLGGRLSQQNVANIEAGIVKQPKALLQIAEALTVSPMWLHTGLGRPEPSAQPPQPITPLPVQPIVEVPEPAGRPDIPVWASVAAGDGDGEMILVDSPIDYVRRSEKMLTVKSPFAFYIVGDSMEPRFSAGDQVVINPSQPVKVGDDCVFIHTASDGTMYGLVKRLLRNLADHYRVRQFNPPKELDLSKRKWAKAYRVAETRHRG